MTELYTEHRPWGYYTILEEEKNYKVKKLVINPGQRLSLQFHYKRSEIWTIVEGEPTITCGENIKEYKKGEYIEIPVKTKHRIQNKAKTPAVIIEVQNGDYLGEDDIVRIEDDYQR